MLYLNNSYLTSEQIIERFELEVLNAKSLSNANSPSALQQFKNKLLSIYFNELSIQFKIQPKATTAEEKAQQKKENKKAIEEALTKSDAFCQGYPQLKCILSKTLLLEEPCDYAVVLEELKGSFDEAEQKDRDWNAAKEQTEFHRLDSRYGYFTEIPQEQQQALHQLFVKLAISCRVMVVLFEKNNTRADNMAYDYAYKLMALFLDPNKTIEPQKDFDDIAKKTHKLLSRSDDKKDKPFHDNLIVKLFLPDARKIKDRKGWRDLIEREGSKFFRHFNMAPKIEAKLAEELQEEARAPKNEKEAKNIAMLCSYSRAKEDPDFAKLCQLHKVEEVTFNASLDYMSKTSGWPKKSVDNLPDIPIKGEGEAQGYYWLKLPVDDKRALILGDITDCCQSIGGHSSQCVKDGIELGNNGFYVLLKQRKKGDFKPISNGAINESDFDIVGQSYAWKSQAGNLCLDSIECLRGGISTNALRAILTDFSTKVLAENPGIQFINVGKGGKTPENLYQDSLLSERQLEGNSYGDSLKQYTIKQRFPYIEDSVLTENHNRLKGNFLLKIKYLSAYYEDKSAFSEQLTILLRDYPEIEGKLNEQMLGRIILLSENDFSLSDLIPIDYEVFNNLEKAEKSCYSLNRLIFNCTSLKELAIVLQHAPEEKHQDIFNRLYQCNAQLFYSSMNDNFDYCLKTLTNSDEKNIDMPLALNSLKLLNKPNRQIFLDTMRDKLQRGIDNISIPGKYYIGIGLAPILERKTKLILSPLIELKDPSNITVSDPIREDDFEMITNHTFNVVFQHSSPQQCLLFIELFKDKILQKCVELDRSSNRFEFSFNRLREIIYNRRFESDMARFKRDRGMLGQLANLLIMVPLNNYVVVCHSIKDHLTKSIKSAEDLFYMMHIKYQTPEHHMALLNVMKDKLPQILNPGGLIGLYNYFFPKQKETTLQAILLKAVEAGHVENTEMLINFGAKPSVDMLLKACSKNQTEMITLLINEGVEPTEDMLFQACSERQTKMVKLLIEQGVKPTQTILTEAIKKEKEEVVQILSEGSELASKAFFEHKQAGQVITRPEQDDKPEIDNRMC